MIVGCDCCTQVYLLRRRKKTILSSPYLVCSMNNFIYVKLLQPLYRVIIEPHQENSCSNMVVVYSVVDEEVR